MSCDECLNEIRLKMLESEITRNKEAHREFYTRFEEVGKEQVKISTTYSTILEKLAMLESKVDTLVCKPTKRWDTLITALIGAFVSAFFMYFFGK